MRNHHLKGFSLYTKVTTTNKVKPNFIYIRQNKVKKLKYLVVLHRKLVKFLRFILIAVSTQ